jgi:hypothetical protein
MSSCEMGAPLDPTVNPYAKEAPEQKKNTKAAARRRNRNRRKQRNRHSLGGGGGGRAALLTDTKTEAFVHSRDRFAPTQHAPHHHYASHHPMSYAVPYVVPKPCDMPSEVFQCYAPSFAVSLPPPMTFMLKEDVFEVRDEKALYSPERSDVSFHKYDMLRYFLERPTAIGLNEKSAAAGDKSTLGNISIQKLLHYMQDGDGYYHQIVKEERMVGSAGNMVIMAGEPGSEGLAYTDVDLSFYLPVDGTKIGGKKVFSWMKNKVLFALARAAHDNFLYDPSLIPESLCGIEDACTYCEKLMKLIKDKYLHNFLVVDDDENSWMIVSYGQGEDKIDLKFVVKIEKEWDIVAKSAHVKLGRGIQPTVKTLPEHPLDKVKEHIVGKVGECNDPRHLKNGFKRMFVGIEKGYVYSTADVTALCEGFFLDEKELTGETSEGYIKYVVKGDIYPLMRHYLDVMRSYAGGYDAVMSVAKAVESSEELPSDIKAKIVASMKGALKECVEKDVKDALEYDRPDKYFRATEILKGMTSSLCEELFGGEFAGKVYTLSPDEEVIDAYKAMLPPDRSVLYRLPSRDGI